VSAPDFRFGDIVATRGGFERIAVHSPLPHDDGQPYFVPTVILEEGCFPTSVHEENCDDVVLVRRARYYDPAKNVAIVLDRDLADRCARLFRLAVNAKERGDIEDAEVLFKLERVVLAALIRAPAVPEVA